MDAAAANLEPQVSLDQRPAKKSRACVHCHIRKVRCNAWEVGVPCTRCKRRNQTSTCVLVGPPQRTIHGLVSLISQISLRLRFYRPSMRRARKHSYLKHPTQASLLENNEETSEDIAVPTLPLVPPAVFKLTRVIASKLRPASWSRTRECGAQRDPKRQLAEPKCVAT
jgi:hypothetical protein